MGYSDRSDRDDDWDEDDEDWDDVESWEELHKCLKLIEAHTLKNSAYLHVIAQCAHDVRTMFKWLTYAFALPFGYWVAITLDKIISGLLGLTP